MGYQSEPELEELLIKQLVTQGYSQVNVSNEKELEENFREQLYLQNKENLEGKRLTDKEFERVLAQLKGKSIYESSKILRDKLIIQREDDSNVYLTLFNTKNWFENKFQITHQTTIKGKRVNRYDVTILINGLPLVQIELKRRGLDLKEAFNQINRYRKDSFKGLYRYIQIFIVSNGVETKYFSNSDKDISFIHTFFWTNIENKRINRLEEFAKIFLNRSYLTKIIFKYMVINRSGKFLMVMRPYQIYAVEQILKQASETNENGYIWHTTGSGKTLTSFKVSQLLSKESDIKKVFFLVDRKDLDTQTLEEFNNFEKNSVDTTDKTKKLVQQIEDINKSLILTTIQKMANAIKSKKHVKVMERYKNEKVIFIIDECHRSQFGKMNTLIDKHFSNAQYFGFTGTPRFVKNKSQNGKTTASFFGRCLHTYLIKDAINDGNVLGFSVEYIRTFKGKFDENDDTKVEDIDTNEVFVCDERLDLVAKNIVKNHNLKTRNGKYSALFTVPNISILVRYYDKFKELNPDFKIAAIFSYGVNEDSEGRDEQSRDSLDRIINDYNKNYDTNFSTDTFTNYFKDVSKKMKNGKIDLLIVVNMFLTGFDSSKLNTLYIDKNLKYHELLQAYSRTNRIDGITKPYGNIVCYRNLKKNTDEAICLFSNTDNTNVVIMDDYNEYLKMWKSSLDKLYRVAPTPDSVDDIQIEEEKKEFIICFRELSKILSKLQTFVEFEFKEEVLGISEQEYQDFKSKYFTIYDSLKYAKGEKVSILSDIDFCIELMHTDKINVSYIMNLIRDIDLRNKNKRDSDIKYIVNELGRADNEELRLKVDLIKEFLEKVVPKLTPENSIDIAYNEYEEIKKEEEISEFAKDVGLDKYELKLYVSEYEYSGILNKEDISSYVKAKLKPKLIDRRRIVNTVVNFIQNYVRKFTL